MTTVKFSYYINMDFVTKCTKSVNKLVALRYITTWYS